MGHKSKIQSPKLWNDERNMTVLVITSSFLNPEKGNGGMPGRETAGRPRNILLNRKTDIGRGVVLKRRVWTP